MAEGGSSSLIGRLLEVLESSRRNSGMDVKLWPRLLFLVKIKENNGRGSGGGA